MAIVHGNRTRERHEGEANSSGCFNPEQFRAIFWASIGEFSAATQASIGMSRISTQSRERELANGREVACGVSFSDATVVLTESDIEHPVHGLASGHQMARHFQ